MLRCAPFLAALLSQQATAAPVARHPLAASRQPQQPDPAAETHTAAAAAPGGLASLVDFSTESGCDL